MAAYHQVYGFSHLQADCRGQGSAVEPYACSEYGTTFTFYFNNICFVIITITTTTTIPCSPQLSWGLVPQNFPTETFEDNLMSLMMPKYCSHHTIPYKIVVKTYYSCKEKWRQRMKREDDSLTHILVKVTVMTIRCYNAY